MSLLSRAGPCARCPAESCPPGADDRLEESISLAHLLLYALVHGNSHMPGTFTAGHVDTQEVYRQWFPHVLSSLLPSDYVSTPSHIHTHVYTTALSHSPPCTHPLCTHMNVYTSHSHACLSSSHIHIHMHHYAHTPPRYLLIRSGTDTPSHAIDMLTHTQATHDS